MQKKLFRLPLIAAPKFGPYKSLYLDLESLKYYIRIELPKDLPRIEISSCWREVHPCGIVMRRPHSICHSCWYLKRQRGEIPEFNEVQLVLSPIRVNRPMSNIGNMIGKRLHELLKYVWGS